MIIKSGIYLILNLINNKIYIGSAININSRKSKHLHHLKNNIHTNKHLQNAYNRYGESNFVFFILERVENKNNLIEKEQYYLDLLKPEYNIRTKAESNLGLRWKLNSEQLLKIRELNKKLHKNRVVSKETRIKQSLWQKGKKLSEEHRQSLKENSTNIKSVLAFSYNIIKEYKSITIAAETLKCSPQAISNALRNNHKSMGYNWKYKNEF